MRSSVEKFRSICDSAQDAILMIDNQKNISYWNKAAEKIFGYSAQEALGKDLHTFLVPQRYRAVFREGFSKFKTAGQGPVIGKTLELEATRKDGTKIPIELSVSATRLKGEWNAIGIIRDITERKLAEKTLKESEELYKDLVEKAGVAILIDDQEGNFKYCNKRYAEIFGFSVEEMKEQSIRSIVHPDDIERVMRYHKGRLEGKKVPSRYELKGIRKDGSAIYLEVYAVVLKEGGKGLGTRSYLWDITERKHAEKNIRQSIAALRKLLGGVINVIVSLVEVKDSYTSGHQSRVADLARTIATEMGLSKDQIEGIRSAGVMHDLGKICVPAEILSKPSKLNESEFELIKAHSQVAYDILKDIEFPWPIARIIYQHHERMDGSGYPQGISGEDICLEARILAVADVVEAMASHRPYRPALGIDKALDEILTNRGRLYDPEVVDTCVKLFKENKFKFRETVRKAV